MGQILDRRDASGIGGVDNNSNGKNAYTKAGFSTYNVVDANRGTVEDNISGTGDDGALVT